MLIVDSDVNVRQHLDGLLRRYGSSPLHAADASGARKSAEEHHVDAFIVAARSIGESPDGDVLAWLRRHPRYRLTPVFVLTGSTKADERAQMAIRQHWAYVFDEARSPRLLVEYIGRVLDQMQSPSA